VITVRLPPPPQSRFHQAPKTLGRREVEWMFYIISVALPDGLVVNQP
jgi:hypothetical protein